MQLPWGFRKSFLRAFKSSSHGGNKHSSIRVWRHRSIRAFKHRSARDYDITRCNFQKALTCFAVLLVFFPPGRGRGQVVG